VIDTGSAQKSCSDAVQKMASATLAAPPRAPIYDTEVLEETLIHQKKEYKNIYIFMYACDLMPNSSILYSKIATSHQYFFLSKIHTDLHIVIN